MKCECGNEFEGNFCPACGKKAPDNVGGFQQKKVEKTGGLSDESRDVLKGAVSIYLNTRLKFMFLGAFLVALMAFVTGRSLSGIVFVICGVLLMPQLLKKYSGKRLMVQLLLAAVCIVMGAAAWEGHDEEAKATIAKLAQCTTVETSDDIYDFKYGNAWYVRYVDDNEVACISSREMYNCVAQCLGTEDYGSNGDITYDFDDNQARIYLDYDSIVDGNLSIISYDLDSETYMVMMDGERYDASAEFAELLDEYGYPGIAKKAINSFKNDLASNDLTYDEIAGLNYKDVKRYVK